MTTNELIERLRSKRPIDLEMLSNLLEEAADCIEGLEDRIAEKQKHLENLQKVNEDLEERIAIMSEGGWHKATELPKKTGDYIVTIIEMERFQSVTTRNYRISFGWGLFSNEKLVCWMPLPEPPKEGEAE